MENTGSLGGGFQLDLWTYTVGPRNLDQSLELRITQGCNRFVHTCLGHSPLNLTRWSIWYGRAVQVLLTVQYMWTHIM